VTVKLTVYNPQDNVTVRLHNPNNYVQTILPLSDTPFEVELSNNDCTYLEIFSRVIQTFYIDNVQVNIQ